MRSKSFSGMTCSIAGALEVIGDRWSILIMRDISFGLSKYEDLRKSTGVTNATLSDRLKHLEENGLIKRRLYQTNPNRYEYLLTRKGDDTALLTHALLQIGDRWAVTGDGGPPMKFTNRKTGARVKLALIDERTGETLETNDLVPKAGPGADDVIRWRLKHVKEKTAVPPR